MERALILAAGANVQVEHLPPEIGGSQVAGGAEATKAAPVSLPADGLRLEEVERDLVRQALDATAGNQVRAARLLGISRDALRTRMKRFGFLS
jgi:DNA-binding NtrC family response regulator